MTDHLRIQEELAAYAAGRLSPAAVRDIQSHLASCDECAALAEGFRDIADGFQRGGAALLDAHPAPSALRVWALDPASAEAGVGRHVETCSSCALEATGWRAAPVRLEARPRNAIAAWRAPMSLAAALVLGIGIGVLYRPMTAPTAMPDAGNATAFAGGPAGLIVLDTPVRGASAPQRVLLPDAQPFAMLAVPASVLPVGVEISGFHVALAQDDGTVVWSADAVTEAVRRQAKSSGVASFLVPSTALTPGPKVFRISPPNGPPLTEIHFVVER